MAAIGVRSSWEASATNRRSRCFGGPQPALRCQPGAEGRLDPGQHDVEGAGQPPDLGGLVLAGDPLGEIAGGDGLGRPLHVAQGAESDADQPQPAEQGHDHGRPGDGQLDQEQVVEGALDVAQRLGHDEQVPVGQRARPAPGTRVRRPGWTGA